MLGKLLRSYYGNMSSDEFKKFSLLGVIFGFTIGLYWMLRGLKDGVFMSVVGRMHIPNAKILSLVIVIPLVLVYSKMIDMFPRHRVFYALCALYGMVALGFFFMFRHPTMGLANTVPSASRWIGWAWYVWIESFGSIMVALFWSFAADTTTPESAKRGYPLIVLGAQLGGIIGPLGAYLIANRVEVSWLILSAVFALATIASLIRYFMSVVPADQLVGYKTKDEGSLSKKSKTGFFEGLRLLLTKPYLLGIFAVVSFFEIIVTMFDFLLKIRISEQYITVGDRSRFLLLFGVIVNLVAALSVIFGVNKIGRKLGLGVALMVLPILVAVAAGGVWLLPSLYGLLAVVVACKGLNYAFNQPVKEQLYIPTSRDAKYKAKGWIEMFGSRGSKGVGSAINKLRAPLGASLFITAIGGITLGIVAVWLMVATYLGKTHSKAVKENKVVV